MEAITSSAPAICGTFFGFTKLAASIRVTPVAASLSQSSALDSGGSVFSSFCNPSLGPTSTICTSIGSPPARRRSLLYLREHRSARDQRTLPVGQRSDPTGVRGGYGLLHLHGLEHK